MGGLPFIVLHILLSIISLVLSAITYHYRKRWPLTLRSPRFTIVLSFLFALAFFLSSLLESQLNLRVSPSTTSTTSIKCATYFGLLSSVINCIVTTCLFRLWFFLIRTHLSAELMKLKDGYHIKKITLNAHGPQLKSFCMNRQRSLAITVSLYCADIILPVLTSILHPTCTRDSLLAFFSDRLLVFLLVFANCAAFYWLGKIDHPADPFNIGKEFGVTFAGAIILTICSWRINSELFARIFECVAFLFSLFVYVGPFYYCYKIWAKPTKPHDPQDTPAHCLTSPLKPRRQIYEAYLNFLHEELSAHELLFWRDVYDFRRHVIKFQKLWKEKPKNFQKINEKWNDLLLRTEHIIQFYLDYEAPYKVFLLRETRQNALSDWQQHFRTIPSWLYTPVESKPRRQSFSQGSDGSPSSLWEKEDSEERGFKESELVDYSQMFNAAQQEVEEHLSMESWPRYRCTVSDGFFNGQPETLRSTEGSTEQPDKDDDKEDDIKEPSDNIRPLDDDDDDDDKKKEHSQKEKDEAVVQKIDEVIEMTVIREGKNKIEKQGKSLLRKARRHMRSLDKASNQIAEVKQITNVTLAVERIRSYSKGWHDTKERSAEFTNGLKNFNRGVGHFLDIYREQDSAQKVDDRIARALDAIGHQL